MCVIVYQPELDNRVSKKTIRQCWETNPDGAGYMFSDGKRLVIKKPFKHVRQFVRSYHADHAKFGRLSGFVLHFRIATHGGLTEQNTHPHKLAKGYAGLAHNGILPTKYIPPCGSPLSDTVHFCKTVIGKAKASQLMDERYHAELGTMIGKGNKFVIMDRFGSVGIVNEKVGHWQGVRWYSNLHHRNDYNVWGFSAASLLPCYDDAHPYQSSQTGNPYNANTDGRIDWANTDDDDNPIDDDYYSYWKRQQNNEEREEWLAWSAQQECDELNREAIESLEWDNITRSA